MLDKVIAEAITVKNLEERRRIINRLPAGLQSIAKAEVHRQVVFISEKAREDSWNE